MMQTHAECARGGAAERALQMLAMMPEKTAGEKKEEKTRERSITAFFIRSDEALGEAWADMFAGSGIAADCTDAEGNLDTAALGRLLRTGDTAAGDFLRDAAGTHIVCGGSEGPYLGFRFEREACGICWDTVQSCVKERSCVPDRIAALDVTDWRALGEFLLAFGVLDTPERAEDAADLRGFVDPADLARGLTAKGGCVPGEFLEGEGPHRTGFLFERSLYTEAFGEETWAELAAAVMAANGDDPPPWYEGECWPPERKRKPVCLCATGDPRRPWRLPGWEDTIFAPFVTGERPLGETFFRVYPDAPCVRRCTKPDGHVDTKALGADLLAHHAELGTMERRAHCGQEPVAAFRFRRMWCQTRKSWEALESYVMDREAELRPEEERAKGAPAERADSGPGKEDG